MTTNLDFDVTGASGNVAQRSRQNLEDRAARDLLFQGAEGRVTSAENYLESSRRNRQMNEAGAYADAAKMLVRKVRQKAWLPLVLQRSWASKRQGLELQAFRLLQIAYTLLKTLCLKRRWVWLKHAKALASTLKEK